ncbi:hypothetical protein GGR34_003163 [Microvirga flocculans]|uniref:Uncharacterized protein n=1 Tax=Microvirga flocculans TaxID=217168 RepID=A0A7W6II06_9HYPH|nr:hypothetical protein [Microvirga flocculans]MBB4041486.1 hypothetical protein [Microvirga flocculans]
MVRTSVALVGLAGAFFVAGSFFPSAFNVSPQAQSEVRSPADGLIRAALLRTAAPSGKGNRIGEPMPERHPETVTIVELVGVTQATVILRGSDGRILYKSDPRSGVTTLVRGTELPVVSLKEDEREPVVHHPSEQREGNEAPAIQKPKGRNPVGCMGDVSPLVKASADRMPSLCLAFLDQSLS